MKNRKIKWALGAIRFGITHMPADYSPPSAKKPPFDFQNPCASDDLFWRAKAKFTLDTYRFSAEPSFDFRNDPFVLFQVNFRHLKVL